MVAANSTHTKGLVRLADAEVLPFIAATPGAVIVDVSTDWCVPCRLLRPILHKLGAEFAGRTVIVDLDGDSVEHFKRAHEIASFPTLIFFKDGMKIGTHAGFDGNVDAIRRIVAEFLGVPIDERISVAEESFRSACSRARATIDDNMAPAQEALGPDIAAVQPALDAFIANLDERVRSGDLTREEASRRRGAEYRRVSAPFQHKVDALGTAQREALAAYDAQMSEAAAHFFDAHVSLAASNTRDKPACQPGDPFCSIE
jgi:thioredoxin 1